VFVGANCPRLAASGPFTPKGVVKNVYCVALTPDGKTLALGGQGEVVELWDTVTGGRMILLKDHPRAAYSLAFSPDGRTLAVGCYKQVRLWDVKTGKEQATLKGHTTDIKSVQFFPDGQTLFTASKSEAKFWQLPSGDELATVKSDAARWVLSPNGQTLVSCNFYWNNVDVWDAGKRAKRPALRCSWTSCVACTPDGGLVATGSKDTLRLWDAATGKQLSSHDFHTQDIVSLDFAPDGKTLASGSKDRTAILWDMTTKKERATLKGHPGEVVVKFAPDGKTVYTGSPGGPAVKLWDAATGKELHAFETNRSGVQFFVTSSEGNVLAVLCRDGNVKLWNVARALAAAR
jgi:WD40 repeat protein